MNRDIVRNFWDKMSNQKFDELSSYFKEDCFVYWPNTGEVFSVKEYIHVNKIYPGNWKIEIKRLEVCNEVIISVVKIYSDEENISLHATSFFTFENHKIARLDEYFGIDEEPPIWRKNKELR
jgi:hypothetical protein